MISYDVRIENQFHFNPDTYNACLPISMEALICMYSKIVDKKEPTMSIENEDWRKVLTKGGELWKQWKEKHPNDGVFPCSDDILRDLPKNDPFIKLFGTSPIEYGGPVVADRNSNDDGEDNPEGSLGDMLKDIAECVILDNKHVAAIITLPHHNTISLLCVREKKTRDYSIYIFDSHGSRSSSECCEFKQFFDYKRVLKYFIKRYDLCHVSSIKVFDHLYTKYQLENFFSYSAVVYVK